MLQYDFENSIGYWLIATTQACEQAVSQLLPSDSITYRQAQVLAYLANGQTPSQAELALLMRVEPPTLVGILDRMEREEWIVRQPCSDDRRRKLIQPGPKANEIWPAVTSTFLKVRAQAVRDFNEQEIELVKELLCRIQKNLTAPDFLS